MLWLLWFSKAPNNKLPGELPFPGIMMSACSNTFHKFYNPTNVYTETWTPFLMAAMLGFFVGFSPWHIFFYPKMCQRVCCPLSEKSYSPKLTSCTKSPMLHFLKTFWPELSIWQKPLCFWQWMTSFFVWLMPCALCFSLEDLN